MIRARDDTETRDRQTETERARRDRESKEGHTRKGERKEERERERGKKRGKKDGGASGRRNTNACNAEDAIGEGERGSDATGAYAHSVHDDTDSDSGGGGEYVGECQEWKGRR